MQTEYLIYSGTSVDGRGTPTYTTRTENVFVALEHFMKNANDPYSFGHVMILTDTELKHVHNVNDFEGTENLRNVEDVEKTALEQAIKLLERRSHENYRHTLKFVNMILSDAHSCALESHVYTDENNMRYSLGTLLDIVANHLEKEIMPGARK